MQKDSQIYFSLLAELTGVVYVFFAHSIFHTMLSFRIPALLHLFFAADFSCNNIFILLSAKE